MRAATCNRDNDMQVEYAGVANHRKHEILQEANMRRLE